MILFHTPLERKKTTLETEPCIVESVEELGTAEYERFSKNLLGNYPFLEKHGNRMFGAEDGVHCLLVLCEESDDGILVDSEGYAYARYAGVLPGARRLIELHVQEIAQRLIETGTSQTQTGDWTFSYEQISRMERVAICDSAYLQRRLADALLRSEQVHAAFQESESVFISFDPAFCRNLAPEHEPKEPCVEIIWDDLRPSAQQRLLNLLGDNGNYDVLPIAVIQKEQEQTMEQRMQ